MTAQPILGSELQAERAASVKRQEAKRALEFADYLRHHPPVKHGKPRHERFAFDRGPIERKRRPTQDEHHRAPHDLSEKR